MVFVFQVLDELFKASISIGNSSTGDKNLPLITIPNSGMNCRPGCLKNVVQSVHFGSAPRWIIMRRVCFKFHVGNGY